MILRQLGAAIATIRLVLAIAAFGLSLQFSKH